MPAKRHATSAIDFLLKPPKAFDAPVCALFGDEMYLKREVRAALRRQVLGKSDDQTSVTYFNGGEAEIRDVRDALAALSLFGSKRRMVVVEEADPFVSSYRKELEEYAEKPHRDAVLVLEVKTWPANTRLAKIVAQRGLAIDCKSPDGRGIRRWLAHRAEVEYQLKLEPQAVDALLDLSPAEVGILDQELAKLSLLVDDQRVVDVAMVEAQVGGWRTRTAWEMIDAASDGDARTALVQLDRLIAAGEQPIGLLAQMSSHLRRFVTAVREIEAAESAGKRLPLQGALRQAGVPPFKLTHAERQLRQIGRERARTLCDWLLEADLAMKGHNSAGDRARMELDRLIVRLSVQAGQGKREGRSHRSSTAMV